MLTVWTFALQRNKALLKLFCLLMHKSLLFEKVMKSYVIITVTPHSGYKR